ncbi:uncharacterized protein [Drosophila pseudoobscura]|uniref:Uncharacterized protein isoform X1 n=1 Tax=Drosophila pseudoobscura pseudoobscura TaxID=46245 RepID=A0A6I8UZU2_DROPS|nr:uncharacterized protein LOC6901683 isoform X1 [Drosophila pseudoobscura]
MDQKKEDQMQTNSQKSGGHGNKKCTPIRPHQLPIRQTALLTCYMLNADVALLEKGLENTRRQLQLLQMENFERRLEQFCQCLDRQRARVAALSADLDTDLNNI